MAQNENTNPAGLSSTEARFAAAAGASAILVGGFFGAIQLLRPTNWWAIFILLPAFAFLVPGFAIIVSKKQLHPTAACLIAVGIIPLTVAGMFLAGADWGIWWPLMIAAPGLGIAIIGACPVKDPVLRGWVRTVQASGVMLMALAAVFLADRLGLYPVLSVWHGFRWWGILMLLPGTAAFYNAFIAARAVGSRRHAGIRVLAAFGCTVFASAAATLGGASPDLQISLCLIAGGLGLIL